MLMKSFKDEYLESSQKAKEEREDWERQKNEWRREYLINEFSIDTDMQNKTEQHIDNIYTLNNDVATVLYVIVMLVGTIFVDRIIIWIAATIIWRKHMDRHKKKK